MFRWLLWAVALLLTPSTTLAQDLTGEWSGRYVCAQGQNGLTLKLRRQGESDRYDGEFITNRIRENPNSIDTRYPVSGYYNEATGQLQITPKVRSARASSARFSNVAAEAVGFVASFQGQGLNGRISNRNCGNVSLSFKRGNVPNLAASPQPNGSSNVAKIGRPTEFAKSAQQHQQGASTASLQARSDLDTALDNIVSEDSRGWLFWRFDRGSVRNARIESHDASGITRIYGEYTFNRGQKGWVRVNLRDEKVECIRFWNEGSCRPFKRPPSHGILSGFAAGIGSASSNSAPSTAQPNKPRICVTRSREIARADGGPGRIEYYEDCTGG